MIPIKNKANKKKGNFDWALSKKSVVVEFNYQKSEEKKSGEKSSSIPVRKEKIHQVENKAARIQ